VVAPKQVMVLEVPVPSQLTLTNGPVIVPLSPLNGQVRPLVSARQPDDIVAFLTERKATRG
jgi:hypothetical protein